MSRGDKLLVKYRDRVVAEKNALKYAKDGDCGLDLGFAPLTETLVRILPGTFRLIPTGVYVKIPDGHFGLVCGRSSTFGKLRIFVVEARIDSGYTGELFVKAWHPAVFGGDFEDPVRPAVIVPWQRIAQLVIIPYVAPSLEIVRELPQTERGATGFGSTGR